MGTSDAGAACATTNAPAPIPNASAQAPKYLRFILFPFACRTLFQPVAEKFLLDIILPLLVIMRQYDRDVLLRPAKHVEPAQLVANRCFVFRDPGRVLAG